jgi:predicted ATPase/DNA-binding SARP family transcriptional activator
VEYRALGPLEVLDGSGHKLPLGGVRQQTVLASLLLRAGKTVGLERLVDELWEEPPATAARTIQAYVSRLRHLLPAGAIESRPGGYALLLNGARLDLQTVEQTAEEGRAALASGEYERAAQLLRQALALWRGPALAGLTSDALRREAERLEELRFEVLEDRLEADLGCGHEREIVPELQALVAEHPFRERPRSQLMLALYRAGRQPEALAAYQDARRTLDELGVEPSAQLRELEQAILRQEASLEADALPSGTATLLFTDIEGSTLLLRRLGERFAEALDDHRRILRAAFAAHGGREVDTQGDSFFAAFHRAADAVAAAIEAQTALADTPTQIRLGLHTGEPELTDHGYTGLDVVRGARLCAAGHGGQILLSETTRALVDVEVRDLGQHWLKDLPRPERIYQVGHKHFPPPRSLNQSNLPLQATELVGRRRELEQAGRLLRHEGTRLLTFVGPPGAGKTRLALALGSELADEFEDGVFFVGLAPITDPAMVETAIAQTLGARGSIQDHLRAQRALLVLDNFEHLLGAAPLLADLLGAAPALRLVVTSREPLHLLGERQFPVRPLPLDDAVRLFVARSREVGSELGANRVVAEICHRLDLLPLAIELAAARTKVLSPEALLARLERRLELLTGGARDLPERQRTLRSTIEWSYQLLSEDERRLFARLAIFVGGCALEAAEEVCEGTLDQLASLVDKSLLVLDEDRLSLHETIREYTLERLAEDADRETVARRHAEYVLRLGEAAAEAPGEERQAWFARLRPELDNLRAALAWTLANDLELALRLGRVSGYFRPPLSELRRWLDEILSRAGGGFSPLRAYVLRTAAYVANRSGDLARARSLYEQSLALLRALGDEGHVALALQGLGGVTRAQGDMGHARSLYEESLALYRHTGNREGESDVLNDLGDLERVLGNYGQAATLLQRSIELARAEGDPEDISMSLHTLGDLALAQGELHRADGRYREALLLVSELPAGQRSVCYCLAGLASVAARGEDAERAGRLWGAVNAQEALAPLNAEAKQLYGEAFAELDQHSFARGREEGSVWTLEEAVAYAIEPEAETTAQSRV